MYTHVHMFIYSFSRIISNEARVVFKLYYIIDENIMY